MRPNVGMANNCSREILSISILLLPCVHVSISFNLMLILSLQPQASCNSLHELDLASLINDDALSLVSSKGYWRNAWKVDLKTYEENDILGFSTPWSRLDSSSTKDVKAVTSHVVLKSLK